MKTETRNQIRQADWPRIIKELALYVANRVRLTFRATGPKIMLPEGLSVEDIVQESIKRFLAEERNWDPSRVDLVHLLKGTARSIIGNLPKSGDNIYISRRDIPDDEPEDEYMSRMNTSGQDEISRRLRNPEDHLLDKSRDELILQAYRDLFKRAEGNEDYESVILAISEGFDKPAEISAHTGLDIKKIYELKRRWKVEFKETLLMLMDDQNTKGKLS